MLFFVQIVISSFMRIVVVVYMYITLFTDILTLECMFGHQSLGVCEVSDPYPLYFEILGETHALITCGCLLFLQIEMLTWK